MDLGATDSHLSSWDALLEVLSFRAFYDVLTFFHKLIRILLYSPLFSSLFFWPCREQGVFGGKINLKPLEGI